LQLNCLEISGTVVENELAGEVIESCSFWWKFKNTYSKRLPWNHSNVWKSLKCLGAVLHDLEQHWGVRVIVKTNSLIHW